jgi:hypothetical protein
VSERWEEVGGVREVVGVGARSMMRERE